MAADAARTIARPAAPVTRADPRARCRRGPIATTFASNGNAWTGAYIADRVADQIADLYGILTPSAAELVAWTYPGDDETAAGAVRLLDERWRQFQSRLGRKAA